jgi:HAD superfamily hydrolase (TIGR01509 family)
MPADGTAGGLQAVLFDMDGLLVDTEHAWGVAEARVVARLGGEPWTPEEQSAMVGGPLHRVGVYMAQRVGGDLDPDEIAADLVATMAELLSAGADHRPGAAELLDDLVAHGVPCGLVSSSPRLLVDSVLASVGGDHFTITVAGDEVPRQKPHPDPYLAAAARLRADPARCVVLEDSPVGVTAAERAGCVVVAVPFAVPIEPAPRRHVVTSLAEIDAARLRALVGGASATPS